MGEHFAGRSERLATRIFLSSTSRDLAEHRRAVVRACSDHGYTTVAMEEFGAQDSNAQGTSEAELRPCDVFVGMYAWRYGYVPKGSSRSVTEMEYEEAVRLDKPRLVFVVAPDHEPHDLLEASRDDGDPIAAEALQRFLERVSRERVWDTFTSPAHLARRVEFALSRREGWQAPQPPTVPFRVFGREDVIGAIEAALRASKRVWLGGIGGVGKSATAQEFAARHAQDFPGGTLWVTLGPGANDPDSLRAATLTRWMRHHHPGRLVDPASLSPATVRGWLGALPRLLVVLDDVWHASAAAAILEIVPSSTAVVLTSRRGDIARQLGAEASIEIHPLSKDDALDMLRDRVGEMPSRTALRELVTVLDGHPLALEIAAATIRREGPDHAEMLPTLLRGVMDGSVTTADIDAELTKPVDATLDLTYQAMGEDLKRRYRALGSLAAEAPITPFLMAAVWASDVSQAEALEDATDRMLALARNAVLTREPDQQHFSQHALVRAHARRLLLQASELDSTEDRYACSVVKLAENTLSQSSERWQEIQLYLPHISFIGDATASRFEAKFGPALSIRDTAAPTPTAYAADHRQLLLRALNFGAAMSTYLRGRPLEGDSAARWLRVGVAAARALDEQQWVATLLLDLGTWILRHGAPELAIKHYAQAAQVSQSAHLTSQASAARHRLALAYLETGRYDEAQALLARLQEATLDDAMSAGVRVAEGMLRRRRGDFEGALESYESALRLVGEDEGQRATLFNNIGVARRALSQLDSAANAFERALTIHRHLGDRREEARTLANLAGVHWDLWNLNQALDLYIKAREAAIEVGDRSQEAHILLNLGTAYERNGDPERHQACLSEALPILEELGDLAGLAAAFNNLGVMRLPRDPREALSLFKRSLDLNVQLGDRASQAKVLNVMGDALHALREPVQALAMYGVSLEMCRSIILRETEAQVLQNMGIVHYALNALQEAERYFDESLAMMRAVGDRSGVAVNLSNLAAIASASGDTSLAKKRLLEASALMRDIGDRRSEAVILRNLEEMEREMTPEGGQDRVGGKADESSASTGTSEQARTVLIGFLESSGASRALYYVRNSAVLQSPEVESLLRGMIERARQFGDAEMVTRREGELALLQSMRGI